MRAPHAAVLRWGRSVCVLNLCLHVATEIPSLEKVQWGWGPIAGLGRVLPPLVPSVQHEPSLSAKAGFVKDEAGAESPPFSREGASWRLS